MLGRVRSPRLEDLEPHEQLALVALIRLMIRLDGTFSQDEVMMLNGLARELGPPLFWRLMSEVQATVHTSGEITDLARSVTRPEIQEWTYRILSRLAHVDGLEGKEAELLEWLKRTWQLG